MKPGNPSDVYRKPPLWPRGASKDLANMVWDHDHGYEKALEEAFRLPLQFDPNIPIHIHDKLKNSKGCTDFLTLMLYNKPRNWQLYAHRLLDAGFSFEGKNQYFFTLYLAANKEFELLDKAIAHGLNINASLSDAQPHNALVSIVEKNNIDAYYYLVAHGADIFTLYRFTDTGGVQIEQSIFYNAMFYGKSGWDCIDETRPPIMLDLLKKGVARLDPRGEKSFIWFTDCHDYPWYLFNQPENPDSFYDSPQERQRYQVVSSYLAQKEEQTQGFLSGARPMDQMDAQTLIDAYTTHHLTEICTHPGWHGHEAHLFELYASMPEHIQHEIESCAEIQLTVGALTLPETEIAHRVHAGILTATPLHKRGAS